MRKRIKFNIQDRPEFITELRSKVSEYFNQQKISRYGNANLFIKTAFMLSLYILPYLMMVTGIITSFWGVMGVFIIMGIGKAGVGMSVMHDANHRSYSGNQKVNKWLSKTMYIIGGFPFNWQYQHNVMHHGFTNIEGHDEDIDPGGYLRFSPHKELRKIHKYQHIYAWFLYGLMTISWVTGKDFKQLNRYRKEGVKLNTKLSYQKLFTTLTMAKIAYYIVFLAIPIVLTPLAWYWMVLFFFLMHFTTGLILTTIFQTAHVVPDAEYPLPDKDLTIDNNWAIHQLLTTSDFSPRNKVLSWFIGGLNYQIEHHLFPNISHVHYPKISKIVRETASKHNLPYHVQPGFFIAVIRHGKMLKKLGRPVK